MQSHATPHIQTARHTAHHSDDDCILVLTLQRPEKKNALTTAMYKALTQALHTAKEDDSVRVVYLCGAGGTFTSGNDIQDFLSEDFATGGFISGKARAPQDTQDTQDTNASATSDTNAVIAFLKTLHTFPKPIVAAVEGMAIGIGTTLLLYCDLVYAADNAVFQLPFINLALVPEAASSLLLVQRIGYQRAAELLFLGEPIAATTMHTLGLVNAVVAPEDVQPVAVAAAQTLARKDPKALQLSKALLQRPHTAAITETIDAEAEIFTQQLQSPQAKAALQAFLNRAAKQ